MTCTACGHDHTGNCHEVDPRSRLECKCRAPQDNRPPPVEEEYVDV